MNIKIGTWLQKIWNNSMFAVNLFEKYLVWARSILTAELFETISSWFVKLGHVMLVGITCASTVFWLLAAARQSNGIYIFYGAACLILFPVLQFTAHRFLGAGKSLILNSPSRLSSAAFLDCLSLLACVTGIMIFITSLMYREWIAFFAGLAMWIACDLVSYVALQPSLANTIVVQDTSPGEDAIGIFSFFIKALMRIVPVIFGAGLTIFFMGLINGIFCLLGRRWDAATGEFAMRNAILCACLPFAGYIIFTLYHLTIDILRAILVIPVKLDRLRDNKAGTGRLEEK